MLGLMAVSPTTVNAQDDFGLVEQTLPNSENTPLPFFPVPSERQLKWNETEFYAFAEKALAVPEIKGLLMKAVNEHNRAEQKERY